jgi:hypothetical protein
MEKKMEMKLQIIKIIFTDSFIKKTWLRKRENRLRNPVIERDTLSTTGANLMLSPTGK